MTAERIKEIQLETAYPNSVSVQQALFKVWNECEQAKEMERIQKLKVQIAENESILEMLRLHGSDASIMRVFSRLESLKEQLKEMEL